MTWKWIAAQLMSQALKSQGLSCSSCFHHFLLVVLYMLVVSHARCSLSTILEYIEVSVIFHIPLLFWPCSASKFVLYFHVSEHFSHVDADPHEVALWVLLKRTQSPNKAIRLQAVQELAEYQHWLGKRPQNTCTSLRDYCMLMTKKGWASLGDSCP